MTQIHFFAANDDLLPVLWEVESVIGHVQYVRTGNILSPDFETFRHGADIPNLGQSDWETGSTSATFLVTKATVPVGIEKVTGTGGIQRYCLDQLLNPDSVILTPAGVWGEHFVLNGRVATISNSLTSQELMKHFLSAFRKYFAKVKAFWVGPQAMELLRAGKRLALSSQSPREFDLVP
jgi:hypothetical protein